MRRFVAPQPQPGEPDDPTAKIRLSEHGGLRRREGLTTGRRTNRLARRYRCAAATSIVGSACAIASAFQSLADLSLLSLGTA